MRIVAYSIAALFILFISFTIWYHQPIELQQYQASTYEGDKTTTIELKVKKYRKIYRPTLIEGELIHNNKVFTSYSHRIGNSAFEQFLMKLDGQVNPASFTYANSNISLLEWEAWTLSIFSSDDLQMLYLTHRLEGRDAESYDYLAPASNAQEAQQLLNQLFNFKP